MDMKRKIFWVVFVLTQAACLLNFSRSSWRFLSPPTSGAGKGGVEGSSPAFILHAANRDLPTTIGSDDSDQPDSESFVLPAGKGSNSNPGSVSTTAAATSATSASPRVVELSALSFPINEAEEGC